MTLVIMLSRKPNYSDQYFRNRLLLFLKQCFLLRNSTHEQFSGPCLTFPMDLLKSSRQLFFSRPFSLFSKTATMSREKNFYLTTQKSVSRKWTLFYRFLFYSYP